MNYIGIDPGLDGALAVITDDAYEVFDTPTFQTEKKREFDINKMSSLFSAFHLMETYVFIEKVASMPGQGVSSTFSFGKGFGIWLGILGALGFRYELIHPVTWKKEMMRDMSKEKDSSRLRALQLFPNADLSRKKDHGRADALLIAEFGRRRVMK